LQIDEHEQHDEGEQKQRDVGRAREPARRNDLEEILLKIRPGSSAAAASR
jgi:hypothetical protein